MKTSIRRPPYSLAIKNVSYVCTPVYFLTLSLIYIQLWEQAQLDNSRLRDDLARTRDELSAAKKKLDTMVQVRNQSISKSN